MRTAVLTSAQQVFTLQSAWEDLHRRTSAPVSMSHTWLAAWWGIFGSRFGMRTLVAWDGDRLVGLFPCFTEVFSLLHVRATRMRFLGEYSILSEYHPLVDPAFEEEFAAAATRFCLDALRSGACDFIDFHAFPSESPFMQRWIAQMRKEKVMLTVRDHEVPRIRIDLPASEDDYLKLLSSHERRMLRKKQRIVAEAGARFECITDPEDRTAFQDYVRLNAKVWDGRGEGSYYSSREGFQQFQEAVTGEFLKRRQARLYFLEQGGQRFAALHAFLMNGVVQAYLGGRDPQHPLDRWSPGFLMMVHVISDAIKGGWKEFDFLTGNQGYKFNLGGTVHGWHGRATVAYRGIRGWKGVMMINAHNTMVAVGHSPRLRRIEQLFKMLSKGLRGGKSPGIPQKS